jgi:hypothetical protein
LLAAASSSLLPPHLPALALALLLLLPEEAEKEEKAEKALGGPLAGEQGSPALKTKFRRERNAEGRGGSNSRGSKNVESYMAYF